MCPRPFEHPVLCHVHEQILWLNNSAVVFITNHSLGAHLLLVPSRYLY